MQLVIDIETCGCELEDLEESQQEYLLRYTGKAGSENHNPDQTDELRRYLSLYPFTAEIVSIGLLNINSGKILVMCNNEKNESILISERNIRYKLVTEKTMLESFWTYIKKAKRVITFKGRIFDFPFLMLRSAVLGIKPARNLVGRRYNNSFHIDLLEQFTFHGLIKKFNLDFYCKAFGIKSPKSKGITGMEIKELYKAGKTREIGVYCAEDVIATHELYKIWKTYINIQ